MAFQSYSFVLVFLPLGAAAWAFAGRFAGGTAQRLCLFCYMASSPPPNRRTY